MHCTDDESHTQDHLFEPLQKIEHTAMATFKLLSQLLETHFIFPRNVGTPEGHADARAFTSLVSGLAHVCAVSTYAGKTPAMNAGYKAMFRVLGRIKEVEREQECVVWGSGSFEGSAVVKAIIQVCVCVSP